VKGKPGLQTVALGLGTCCHHRQIVVTVSLHTSLRMMEYAAPPGAFSSLKSALAKEDICRHRPTNQKAEKEKRQNRNCRTRLQHLNHLKSSKQTCVQNNKVCLHFRLDVHHGRMRKIHAIQEETCRKQFAKKERHSGRE